LHRLAFPSGSTAYDLDLPLMLRRRSELFAAHPVGAALRRVDVPIDLQVDDGSELLRAAGLDPRKRTFVAWEGGRCTSSPPNASGSSPASPGHFNIRTPASGWTMSAAR